MWWKKSESHFVFTKQKIKLTVIVFDNSANRWNTDG